MKNGATKEFFLGSAEPQIRGAEGILEAIKTACNTTLNCPDAAKRVFSATSSLVTDGASVNIGHKNGLWELFKKEKNSIDTTHPFVTFWCAVHRTNLAWDKVTKDVTEISHLIATLSSISAYFHSSGLRTRELKTIAEKEKISVSHFPTYFEVRWTEFTSNLLNAILNSWLALVLYFKENVNDSKECKGYYDFLTKYENMKLISSLADVSSVFAYYKKKITI